MTALLRRLVFRLPWRQTEGCLRSVLAVMRTALEAPDHTTLSRRSQHLALALDRIPAQRPVQLIVESTGLSIVGEGEWAAVQHGTRGQRGWKKRHFGVDRSGVIIAPAVTEPTADAATTGISLIEQVDGDIASVPAAAAYDTIAFYEAAWARGARVVVPPATTASVARRRPRSGARDRTITRVKRLGRRRWKTASGYQRQARVESDDRARSTGVLQHRSLRSAFIGSLRLNGSCCNNAPCDGAVWPVGVDCPLPGFPLPLASTCSGSPRKNSSRPAAIPLHTDPRSARAKAHGVYRLLKNGYPGAIRGAPTGGVRPPPRAGLQTASWWAGARPYAVPRRTRRRDVAGRVTTHVRGDSSVRVPPRVHWGAW